jgi:hypothetical protein
MIANKIIESQTEGMVATAAIIKAVCAECPDIVPSRELEDAIAGEAVMAGLAVHFDHHEKPAD